MKADATYLRYHALTGRSSVLVKSHYYKIFLCTLCSIASYLTCNSQSYPVSVLTVDNGLLSGAVECGLYDSRGFVWIGTREGLHRYDGKNVVRYLPDIEDPGTISSRSIFSLAEDHYGHIWIIGNHGVEVFLPEENCFEKLESYAYDAFSSFRLIDSLDIGIVYGYRNINSSTLISLAERQYINEYAALNPQQQKIVNATWLNRNYIGSYFPSSKSTHYNFTKHFSERHDEVVRIKNAPDGIWCYTRKKGGFTKFTDGDSIGHWKPVYHAWPEIEKNGLMSMMDYNDTLAIAGLYGFGLLLFDKQSGNVLKSWDLRNDPYLGKISDYLFLMKDPAGRVWFSLLPYGVFVFDPMSPRFQLLQNGVGNSALYNGLIRSLCCDSLGRLWLGYHDGHVQVMDENLQKECMHFDLPPERNSVKPQVSAIDHLPNGSILINGMYTVTEQQGINTVDAIPSLDSLYIPNFIDALRIPDYVPVYFNKPPGKLKIIGISDVRETLLPASIIHPLKLFYLKNQMAFFTGPPNCFGILSFERQDSSMILDQKCNDLFVSGIYRDEDSDTIWLATDKGLGLYNYNTHSFQKEDTRSWPSNYLYGILPDDRGNLWISSNAGLVRYHPDTKAARFIGVPEGMQSNEFNTNSYAKMKDGSLAFAGPGGLNIFHPSYFNEKAEPFYVYISGVSIKEKPVSGFNPLLPDIEWRLRPDQKSIEVNYVATKYFQRTGLNYYVQLVGADPDWVDRDGLESVRYINLKPDTYTLRIKAKDGQGNWSQNEALATIIVRPTFFQTTWFMILCIIVLFSIIYGLYTYRISQIKKLHTVRNRISHDLHDDVGSTLGSISIYSEVAKTVTPENRADVLDKIGEASREMLDKLNDIVWSINPENDTLEKLEARMRGYAAMVLHPKGIDFTLETNTSDSATSMTMEKRRNLFLIFKEAIYNVAKYSGCRKVNIRMDESRGNIRMEITDDGKGFNTTLQDAYNGNGIKSMKERARAMQGKLHIISTPGAGTKILLDV